MAEMLKVLEGRSKVMLRVQFSQAKKAAASLNLPNEPLTTSGRNPQALWLAPDQWLLTSDNESARAVIRRCGSTLDDLVHSATDTSAALTAFRLEHPCATTLLAMGSGLDFARLSAGQCARTRLAQVSVVVVPLSGTSFDLYVDRSYSLYLEHWMSLAATDPLCDAVS